MGKRRKIDMKRIVVVLALFVLATFGIYASAWVWYSPYANVTNYRYQLGGEAEDGWTYVDSSVESFSVDEDSTETLYVQLSLDGGKTWSPSGMATFTPDVLAGSGDESFMPTSSARRYQTMIDVFLGFDFSDTVNYNIGAELAFKNVYSPVSFFGLDVALSGGAIAHPETGNDLWNIMWAGNIVKPAYYDMAYFVDAGLYADFYVGPFDFAMGVGGGVHFFENERRITLASMGTYNMNAYVFAGARLERYFGSVFHLGLSYKFKYSFGKELPGEIGHSADLHIGLTL